MLFSYMTRLLAIFLLPLFVVWTASSAYAVSVPDSVTGQDMVQQVFNLAFPKDKKKNPLAWGTPYAAIKAQEKNTLEEEIDNSLLGYRVALGDASIYMVYVFDAQGELAEVDFFLNYTRSENSLYVDDYQTLVANFINRFGKPLETRTDFGEGVDEDAARENMAEAYENGEVKTVNSWVIGEHTRAVATIGGEESGISLAVMFSKKD